MNTLPVTNQDTLHHGKHAAEPAQYGVYDKPADRRLAPWITIGSIILMVCSTIPSHLPFSSLEHTYSSTSSFHHSFISHFTHTVFASSLNNPISNPTFVVVRCMPHRLHLRQARNCELSVGLPHQWNHPRISWHHWTPCWSHQEITTRWTVLLGLPWRIHCMLHPPHHQRCSP